MATNCIEVPRFLAQAAPRAMPGRLMCNSTGAAAATALDRIATKPWRACTTWDTDREMHKDGGSGRAASPTGRCLGRWAGAAGGGSGEQSPVTQMGTAGLSREAHRHGIGEGYSGLSRAPTLPASAQPAPVTGSSRTPPAAAAMPPSSRGDAGFGTLTALPGPRTPPCPGQGRSCSAWSPVSSYGVPSEPPAPWGTLSPAQGERENGVGECQGLSRHQAGQGR